MKEDPSRRATVVQLSPQGADAQAVAEAAASDWRGIEAALSPIIGQGGVAALFRRSRQLAAVQHPWLTKEAAESDGFVALHAALALQSAAEARAAHDALLLNFRNVLARLVGASLTERLLEPVFAPSSSGDAAQDTSP
jgi:hypothetical protein